MELSTQQIEQLRSELLKIKADLEKKQQQHGRAGNQQASGIDNHPADRASDYEEEVMQQTFQLADQQRLEEVQASLKQIEDGSYGICIDTGKPIPFERLAATPYAKRTIEAQREFDERAQALTNEQAHKETMRSLADAETAAQRNSNTTARVREEHDAF
ncbi:TraR/DksA C4-type zinc finger protein [Alkalihalobacillus oceani]|uniref:TraR/DksA C4-type zinc finger protein n=1 Tax=Halalkalibacter oceani TaxID=1653776 RepID=UPI00203B476B|nr:TraR/DksA C4-type zinc finger protein [Halalkalibacter oceani]MCM3760833.1 TraR/DksA C4-type zinc finger protein [Halalkalibacter oceani]